MLKKSNPAPKRIFLARHGESVANQQKLISGQMDAPLTEKGKNQAQWLCDVLQNERLSAIYASSLSRAMETATLTAERHGLAIRPMDGLKEIHFGALQGRPADELRQSRPHTTDFSTDDLATPESENPDAFESRVTECLETVLREITGSALIVAHRNTNQVILSKLLGLEVANKAINVKNKYLYEIELGETPIINTIRLGGEFHGKKFIGLKDE
jgi:broad specificity phosphatase PhoE